LATPWERFSKKKLEEIAVMNAVERMPRVMWNPSNCPEKMIQIPNRRRKMQRRYMY
tara:strand:+ start:55 stop:222 length:168 start_codon:yes stop_codon:yes gene_type:complete